MALTEERFMQLMEMMNEKQSKDIEKRMAGQLETVKSELTVAIKSVSDRQDDLEGDQKLLKTQIVNMQDEISEIRSLVQSQAALAVDSGKESDDKPGRSYAAVTATTPDASVCVKQVIHPSSLYYSDHDRQVAEIIDHARRTVGLFKIDNDDLKRMRLEHFGGAKSEEEEKQLAVKEYLRCELKFDISEIDDMEVENIFIPAKDKGEPQSLNVTFKSVSSVSKIYEKTRIMRKESRVINYIPRQFQDRLFAISNLDYNIRSDKTYQTRIKMGIQDLELHKKLRGSKKWERVPLPSNLPPVDLSDRPAPVLSDSPPPGRPGHQYSRGSNKRDRDSTGSNTDQICSKVVKLVTDGERDITGDDDASFDQLIEKADLVTEGSSSPSLRDIRDPGSIISIQGTPAKLTSQANLQQQSPIISRSTKTY